MSVLRILVADDHEVVRKGVKTLLESHPGWTVCGEATNGREAVAEAQRLAPDMVILDVTMPGLNGLDATRQIRRLVPRAEVLILTVHESEQMVKEILSAGARGYVLKSDAGRELAAAVEAMQARRPYFTAKVAERMLDEYVGSGSTSAVSSAHESLTPRERELLQLLAEGKTGRQAARILKITVKTAATHRTNLMKKLDVHNLAGLVQYAIRNKIIEP